MAKAINYTGFGETHGLREWARLLDVNKDTLRYWLAVKGLTVEEFAKKNGIRYTPRLDEGRTRVNRMAQAEALLADLFDRSGYDPEGVEAKMAPGTRRLLISYYGSFVGSYQLDSGAMKMQIPDESINLINYPLYPKIYRYPEGWGAHPNTRSELVQHLVARAEYDWKR